jgi:uncharacterized protein YkwD
MYRRLLTLLSGAVAALLVVTLAPAPAAVAEPAGYAKAAFKATNQERVERDRKRLQGNACLKGFAVSQAKTMARLEVVSHQALSPILTACNLQRVGENVAAGYPTGRAVVRKGWMKSTPHRKNILDRRFRLMAIAARKGDDGRWYVAQVFGRR